MVGVELAGGVKLGARVNVGSAVSETCMGVAAVVGETCWGVSVSSDDVLLSIAVETGVVRGVRTLHPTRTNPIKIHIHPIFVTDIITAVS
jgi:hypothetical protein